MPHKTEIAWTGSPALANNETEYRHAEDRPVQAPSPREVHGFKWLLVVLSILSSTLFFGLDTTVAADVQPAIVSIFASVDRLPWISVAFLVGAASTNFLWGQLYANFDAKWLYIVCVALFEIGSAICGASPNMTSLIVGRVICGFGGAGMYTGVMTLLSTLTTEGERPAYLGATGLTWGVGVVLGPLVGGGFAISAGTWRWAFYINLVIGGVCAPVYVGLIPSVDPKPGSGWRRRWKGVDVVGNTILAGILVALLMGINFGGLVYAWGSGQTIALFVVAGVLTAIFWIQQIRCLGTTKEARMFPVDFLRDKDLVILFFIEACASTVTFIPIYFVPLYFQFAKANSALEAGVRVLPLVVFLVFTITGNGLFMSFSPRPVPWIFVGGAFGLIGAALLYTVDVSTTNAKVFGYCIMIGFGAGCYVTLIFSVTQAQVEAAFIPISVGFVSFAQLAGSGIALAVANTVFLNSAFKGISAVLPELSAEEVRAIILGVGSQTYAALASDARSRVVAVIVESLSKVYIIAMVSGGLTVVLSLFMKRGKMYHEKATSSESSTIEDDRRRPDEQPAI